MAAGNLPERVLIVDDDPTVANGLVDTLGRNGVKVVPATTLDSALYLFNQNRFEVACVELDFEPQPGLILLQKWRNHEIHEKRLCGFVLLIGNKNDRSSGESKLMMEIRDVETIVKPFTAIQLLPILARARASRARAIKYEEVRSTAIKLAAERLDKALAVVQKQLPELGTRGIEMMLELNEKHEKYEDALKINDTLLSKDSNHVGYLNTRGRLLLRLGRHDEALVVMEKADKAAPDNIARINELAQLYLRINQPDHAVGKMKQLINFHPESPDMKFDMFSQLQEYGFDTHALNLCKETTSPIEVVRYYNNKGVALKNVGNIEGALLEYDRSLKFYPKFKENYRILYNIALAQMGFKTPQGYEIALDNLNKCLELKKDFDKAIARREQLLKILGKRIKSA